MATTRRPKEYKFKIDAYSPETMPLGRLTEYLRDLSEVLGDERANVHLIRVDGGSTQPVLWVDPEAEPKMLHRFQDIENRDAPRNVLDAVNRINKRLRMDGAKGAIINPEGDNVIYFPGVERADLEYGPFNQVGTLDGIPILRRFAEKHGLHAVGTWQLPRPAIDEQGTLFGAMPLAESDTANEETT